MSDIHKVVFDGWRGDMAEIYHRCERLLREHRIVSYSATRRQDGGIDLVVEVPAKFDKVMENLT